MNTHVTFEISKLLKGKGFDELTKVGYMFSCTKEEYILVDSYHYFNNEISEDDYVAIISAPTIAEVVMWLYEKHGIWVSIKTIKWNYEHNTIRFNYNIVKFNDKNRSDIIDVTYDFNSPTEAYQKAIIYTLTNLL